MKSKKGFMILIFLLSCILVGCTETLDEAIEEEGVFTIDFVDTLTIFESEYLTVTSSVHNDVFQYTSSDEKILVVDSDGKVTAIAGGTALITVTSSSGKKATKEVIVYVPSYVESIEIKIESKDTYYAGVAYKYEVLYKPVDAVNKAYVVSTSDYNTIIDDINQTVTFMKAGEGNLYVYLKDNWRIDSRLKVDVIYQTDSNIYDLLFIGNSLTKHTYNIPEMVQKMIELDGNIAHVKIITGYQFLDDQVFTVTRELNKNLYTHVILQEQSSGLITDMERFQNIVRTYNELIIGINAKTILYQTWAYDIPDFEEVIKMHNIISNGYKEMALEIDSLISLVGDVFLEIIMNNPEINLYLDINHPSIYGAYLSALVHYKTITNKSVLNVKYIPDEISSKDAEIIKNAVEKITKII